MQQTLPLPKYHSIYLVLKERLRDGEYDVLVPGELELTREFGVSRATVRKALENLTAEGLIERSAGRGTRRLPQSAGHAPAGRPHATGLAGLLDNIVAASLDTTIKVLEHKHVRATEPVARMLGIAPDTPVLCTRRVRSTDAGPVSCTTAWVIEGIGRHLDRRRLGRKPMLALIEEAGVAIGRARQSISARQADAELAALLGVPLGAALLSVERLILDAHERPILWLHGAYRPDRYQYDMELSQVGAIDAKVWVGTQPVA